MTGRQTWAARGGQRRGAHHLPAGTSILWSPHAASSCAHSTAGRHQAATPDGLGMAMLDAIWAMGARYAITRGVLARYVSSRRAQRADPFHDNVFDLLAEYERHGGVDGFIEEVGSR
jgi:hypothetical protein